MVAYNAFYQFVQDLSQKVHNLLSDTPKFALSNTLPVKTNTVLTNIAEIANYGNITNNATTGRVAVVTSCAQTTGTLKWILQGQGGAASDLILTATGTVGPFQYIVLYNDTPTSPADPLIAWWDYGTAMTMASPDTFTIDFDATNGVAQITSPP